MPRRRRRFADLERQARDNGGVAAPGSKLAGYLDFKKGINKIEVKNKLTGADRKRFAYAVLPFGIIVPATPTISDRYVAPITAYSNSGRQTLTLSKSQCGYEDVATGVMIDSDFYPAIIRPVIVNTAPVSSGTSPISGITKKEYKRPFVGKSFGIPFGRTVTGASGATIQNIGEKTVRDILAKAVKDVPASTANVKSVSFLPEEFKSPRPELASPTGNT